MKWQRRWVTCKIIPSGTQGRGYDLIEHLKDPYLDLSGGKIAECREVGELIIS